MANHVHDFDMEALRLRAWETTVPADGDHEAAAAARIEWLRQASPDDWHRFVLGFNWDDPLDPLEWIVRQDQCDMATALDIFWRSVPGWDLMLLARGETPNPRAELEIIAFIANRIAMKGYDRSEIAWEPEPGQVQDYEEMKRHLAQIATPPWQLSRALIRPIRGRIVLDSADAWAARPEGVRTGFWMEWPAESVVTERMLRAEDKLHDALFYGLVLGSGLAIVPGMLENAGGQGLRLGAALGVIGWAAYKLFESARIVRAVIAADGNAVPKEKAVAALAVMVLLGIAAIASYRYGFVGARHLAGRELMLGRGLLVLFYAGAWFGLIHAARFIVRRLIYR